MICFPQRLPNVIWCNHRMVPLSEGWLEESINDSAHRAGYANWEMSGHVATALAQYFEDECRATAISVEALEMMIRKSLEGIGFGDVAACSQVAPPRVNIYLPELAAHANMELRFFPLLRAKLEEAVNLQVRGVRLVGMRECVKILDSARKWRTTCRQLTQQIIGFSVDCLEKRTHSPIDLVVT
jgi:hypothetical protein